MCADQDFRLRLRLLLAIMVAVALSYRSKIAAVAATLAFVALALRILVPAGFMIAAPTSATNVQGYIPITLCTSVGKVTVLMGDDGSITPQSTQDPTHGEDSKSPNHADCLFAGNIAATLPPQFVWLLYSERTLRRTNSIVTRDLVPGRGLAAPPPPSTAPPKLI